LNPPQPERDKKGGLTYRELLGMMYGNRNAGDLLGWSFQFFLWSALWLLAADPNTGVLSKRDVLSHYDGSLYYEIERRRKDGKEKLPLWRFGTGLSL
jgi:PAS domain-containing protein